MRSMRALIGRVGRFALHRAATAEEQRWAGRLADQLEAAITEALASRGARASLAAVERRATVSRKVPFGLGLTEADSSHPKTSSSPVESPSRRLTKTTSRRTGSKRTPPTSRTNSRKVVAAPISAELDAVLLTIEEAVRACIQCCRWEDLAAAVTVYAAWLRLDPSFLLHLALIRPKAREALTLTDPDQQRYYAEQLRASLVQSVKPQTLAQAIASVRSAVEHRPAFEAFAALGGEVLPEVVH